MNADRDLNPKASQIGRRLKNARKRAKLRQEDVAERLKVHPVTVSRWENGEGTDRMQGPAMRQLAALYGTTVEALFGEGGSATSNESELSMDVSRGTPPSKVSEPEDAPYTPRLARNLPLAIREYLAEFQFRLVKGGATEDEIDKAMTLLMRNANFVYNVGGTQREFAEPEVLRGIKGIGEGVIIPELRERGRKVQ